MSKASPTVPTGTKPTESAPAGSKKPAAPPHHDASRETLESIAFAFVLALLFRTFVAEAFVIPTGSMAPTLFGRNKHIVCSECHYNYEVGASDELGTELNDDGYLVRRIDDSVCPNCRFQNRIRDLPVFKGDRILVNKFPYQISDPERWDVVVFRYPEDPQKNYIKRLVGLPGETIRISRGDVYASRSPHGDRDFEILRKQNPNKQKVLQQLVYDDRYPPRDLLANGLPERWSPMLRKPEEKKQDGWVRDDGGWRQDTAARSFSIDSSDDAKWIRYQHLVPLRDEWRSDHDRSMKEVQPHLITDFCGYNAFTGGHRSNLEDDRFWVGDLTLDCTVEILSINGPQSELILELVEGVRRYRCRIDVSSGQATLLRNDDLAADSDAIETVMASAQTPIRAAGKYTISFANVDDRLCLWINSSWLNSGLIPFGPAAEFVAPANRNPQEADLAPVGIAARGIGVRVSELVLQRDIYYRAESLPNKHSDLHEQELPESPRVRESLVNPFEYGEYYSQYAHEVAFARLNDDEFFVMGDNSPRSQDSRLWPNRRDAEHRHAVPRQALLGKAFFIYWPHGIPFLNGGKGFRILNHSVRRERGEPAVETYPEYVFPFYPQWWRWKRIR